MQAADQAAGVDVGGLGDVVVPSVTSGTDEGVRLVVSPATVL